MLGRILKRLRNSNAPINLGELSRELGVDRSALDGMLLQLVRQGKLREIETNSATCGSCSGCASSCTTAVGGRVYAVVESEQEFFGMC